jgi:probable rRNA maturation factor
MDFISINVPAYELSVVLTDDIEVQELNTRFRNKDKPTNILSFPMYDLIPDDLSMLHNEPSPVSLGDIVLAHETILREAKEQSKSVDNHLKHLLVHGCLHILGYDHIRDNEAAIMEKLEITILDLIGVENPY